MAFRREEALAVGGFDARFRFYRNADIDFSFRLRDRGGRAMVLANLPISRHEHRLWKRPSRKNASPCRAEMFTSSSTGGATGRTCS